METNSTGSFFKKKEKTIDKILGIANEATKEKRQQQDALKTPTDLTRATNGGVVDKLLGKTSESIKNLQTTPAGNNNTGTKQNEKKGSFFSPYNKDSVFGQTQSYLKKGVRNAKNVDVYEGQRSKWLKTVDQDKIASDVAEHGNDLGNLNRIYTEGTADQIKNPRAYATDIALLKKMGQAGDNNYAFMNDYQLSTKRAELEGKRDTALEKEKNYRENLDELKEENENAATQQGIYHTLADRGVPFYTRFGDYQYFEPNEWNQFYDDDFLKAKPEDYYDGNMRETYDRAMYDALYGEGAYEKRIDALETNEDVEALESEMDNYWSMLENGGFDEKAVSAQENYFETMNNLQGDFGSKRYQNTIDKIAAQQERNESLSELEANRPNGTTEYNPELVQTIHHVVHQYGLSGVEVARTIEKPVGDKTDQAYFYANHLPEEGWTLQQIYENFAPEWFLDDKTYSTFMDYYNSGDKESAQAVLDGAEYFYQQIAMEAKGALEQMMAADGDYWLQMSIYRTLTPEIAGVLSMIGAVQAITGNEEAKKPWYGLYNMSNTNANISAGRQKSWGDQFAEWFGEGARGIGETGYRVTSSVVDNIRRNVETFGVSKMFGVPMDSALAKTFDFMLLGSDVIGDTFANNLAGGMDPEEAFVRAAGAGAIEIITENMWWDSVFSPDVKDMLGNPRQFAKYLFNIWNSEGFEEVSGTVMDAFYDEFISALYNSESELDSKYHALVDGGMDPAAAKWKVLGEWFDEIGESYLMGGFSSLIQGAGRATAARTENNIINKEYGRQTVNFNVAENATKMERFETQQANREGIVSIAKEMGVGTESRELGEKASREIEKGKKVSDADIGAIARALLNDTNGSIQASVSNILQERISEQMEEMGEKPENIEANAASLVNLIAGTATDADMVRYLTSESMKKLLSQYRMSNEGIGEKRAEVEEETQKAESIRETVSAMIAPRAEVSTKAIENVVKDAKVATAEEISKAEGKVTGNPLQVVTDGKIKEIAETKLEGDGDGKHIQVYFTDGTNADIADVKATNIGAAQVLEFANLNGNKTTSDAFTNALLRNVTKEGNAAALISGAMRIRWDVVTGQKTYNSGLDAKTAGELRDAAEADYAEAEARRLKNYRQINPGKGKTTYNGVAYGTKAFQEAIKGLSRDARTEAVTIGALAKSAGFDVELINDPNSTKEQGSYSANGGIVINLAGEYRDGVRRSALATLPHEITHWLEGNSPEAYKALRQFVLNTQKANGVNLEQRLQNIMDSYAKENVDLDMFDAVSEMVAKSCEEVLTDESVIRRLRESDPNTYGKVRKAVSMAITRVKEALGMAKATSSIYAQTIRDYADKLSDLWMKAYEEAKQVKGTGEGREAAQASVQESEKDRTTRIQKKNSDIEYDAVNSMDKNKLYSPDEVRSFIKGSTYHAFEQWLHNHYPSNTKKIVSLEDIKEFIKEDNKRIKEGAASVSEAWNKMAADRMDVRDISTTKTTKGNKTARENAIYNDVFKGKGYVFEQNTDTGASIRADKITVEETFSHNKVNDNTIEKVLRNIKPLIKEAKYIGSHVNYAHENGNVHYLIAPFSDNGTDRIAMFAVHDAIDANQRKAFSERAYVAEIIIANKTGAFTTSWASTKGSQQGLRRTALRNVSIGELIDNVNDDRIRFYNKSKLKNKRVQMSVQETDDAYMDAVKNGNEDLQQYYVNMAAERAGYTETVYHGTQSFGFTEFDMGESQNEIFVSYDIGISGTYTEHGKVRNISDNKGYVDYNSMDNSELADELWKSREKDGIYGGFKSVEGTEDGGFRFVWGDGTTTEETRSSVIRGLQWMNNRENDTEGIYELFANPGKQLVVDAEGENWDKIYFEPVGLEKYSSYDDELPLSTTREIADWARRNGYDSVRINNVTDNGGRSVRVNTGDIGIYFHPEALKSADAVVYDDQGKVIPPSERFNEKKTDIRYSIADDGTVEDENGDAVAQVLPSGNVTAYSLRTVEDTVNEDLVQALVKQGFTEKEVRKWVADVYGVAKYIADHRQLDFEAVAGTMLKNNQEYVKTLDASTLCAKRLLYQGIFNEIQSMLPNTPLLPDDLIKLINMMKKEKLVTPCAFCYVESRRKMLGKYADEWLKGYKGAYKPTLAEVTTTDGLEKLRNAPEGSAQHQAYEDFVDAMNAKGSANPKVVQLRTDYKGEIRKLTANQIEKVKEIGGLRVQSFSDFETVHLLDMMQAVMDMAAMDLTSQAYTKVPDFAWVFGDTGIKINLSLVGDGNGVDANGNLLFSDTEGMPLQEAMDLRARYGKNVGTILVGMNEEHIIAAMGDDRIDFIIPFHKSGWSKNELLRVSGMSGYKDFTRWQNEKRIATDAKGKPIRSANGKGYKTIPNKKSKISNYGPVNTKQEWDGQSGYWDYSKTGIENAERYLQLCKEDMRLPKFYNFLIDNGDGSYRLPTEKEAKADKKLAKIRKGYWKTLIDFKMYDNEGNAAPQETVKPVFNMDAAMKIMKDFKGDASKLPTDHKIAKQFVEEKKAENPRKKQWSIQEDMEGDIRSWMMTVKPEALQNDAERELLKHWQNMNTRMELYDKKVHDLSGRIASMKEMVRKDNFKNNSKDAQRKIRGWNVELTNAKMIRDQAMKELAQIESDEGYGKILRKQTQRYNEFQSGKTQAEVADEIENLRQASEEIAQAIRATQKRVAELGKKDSVKEARAILEATKANDAAGYLKRLFNSSWTKAQLRTYIDPILALAAKQNLDDPELQQRVRELAEILVESDTTNTYETIQDLRGITITIGKGAQKELRATHRSINDIRDHLAGTGIKIRFGDASNLDTDTGTEGDLRAKFPTMPVIRDDLSAIDQFVEWVNGMRGQENMEFYEEKVNEAYAEVMAQAVSAAAAGNIYTTSDPKARKQILDLVEYIRGMKAETDAAIRTLEKIGKSAETLFGSGKNAAEAAQVLVKNMNDALEYYNLSAKLAMQHAKIDRNTEIIDQLKSENAQKIAKNNEEWRNLIERDKQAQRQAENNRVYRSRINTALKRTFNLLKNPKGMQNIPEYMQGLARELLETFVDNDLNEMRMQKITLADKGQLEEAKRLLEAWKKQDGEFNMADLNDAEDAVASVINMDLLTIYDGIAQLNGEIRGKNKLNTMTQRGEILRQVQEAVSEIYSAIRTEGKIQVNRRMIDVQDQAYRIATELNGKNRKEWTGKIGNVMNVLHKGIVSGNMTPEYFFRTIGNAGLSELWDNYHDAENRNGLELKKAQTRLAEIAEKHGYEKWDMKQKITLPLESGDVTLTLGQLMSLWATWKRENTLGPAMSEHLTKGGFYAEEDTRDGLLGRRTIEKKAHRVTEADMQRVEAMLTDEQLAFIDDVVGYMSTDMSELGNEASMAAYGIKMYKEGYYFPFQMWDGIRSRKSNDSGSAAAAQDRAFHPSFSKSRLHGANNALVIGDFMQTAADHIAGMINYATMGLANESLQKTLNLQLQENEDAGVATKRNVWTMMEEAYGQEAMQYLRELQKQLNGGAVKIDKTFYDKLISLFRKNAVAGSLSVALQQPLSYIRAAMMMNPKYMAQALNPATWKGSYKEMLAHSGVAVIKDMGRFDMNFGQSAREFLTPDGLESKPAKVWNAIEEYSTKLPELMDRMTWTRMWSAVKAEQKALHPEMDEKSDEFLDLCGERFNDIMRRTQVYDSVLVKSANMRSQNPFMKTLTSFMAEPTLTLNVLADSVRMAKNGEAGGKAMVGKAAATFILSAILQAAVKGLMGSGRTPDEKKTWLENFAYKFWYNFFNEVDPLQLVPGFSDAVTLLKGGDLKDDALNTIKKMIDAYGKIGEILNGGGWRAVEDSIGQIVQMYSGVPMKNLMRDGRAMWNWFIDQPYAERETSGAVLKGQATDLFFNADNMLGVVNKWLGDAGYDTSNMGYYEQIYNAKKRGDEQAELDLIDYLINGKGIKAETIESKVNSIAKKDESLSAEEKAEFLISLGSDSADDYIRDQLKQGNMTAAEARKELKKAQPDKDENAIWWTVDRIEYAKETGGDTPGGYYYRLEDAINSNSANAIKAAVQELTAHGVPKDNVKKKLSDWKKAYLSATGNEKVRIKNALIMAYKALGYSETEANEIINKWK